jgi:hypothetical protein
MPGVLSLYNLETLFTYGALVRPFLVMSSE